MEPGSIQTGTIGRLGETSALPSHDVTTPRFLLLNTQHCLVLEPNDLSGLHSHDIKTLHLPLLIVAHQ